MLRPRGWIFTRWLVSSTATSVPRWSLRLPVPRKLPLRWAKSDGPTPGVAYSRSLHFTHRAWTPAAGAEGEHVARSWFIVANPVLPETTPLTAIRNDRGADLMLAVKGCRLRWGC